MLDWLTVPLLDAVDLEFIYPPVATCGFNPTLCHLGLNMN
jgi:hypothetical protein